MMWKSIVEPDRPQIKIWCMRIGCWTTKSTNIHSEHVILIAFQLLQWSHTNAFQCYVLRTLPALVDHYKNIHYTAVYDVIADKKLEYPPEIQVSLRKI
jgi:hypothetical protein